ncbi:hypothetical protein N7474_010100 [Penicillium riverlandense]|uniref:uncharacterized protein n=1 Tax=Penicillium riverlandense TaxID=1903569 RepID=UPI002548072A|nr:uncharacterized protein N7474_010100 [Penicillium riverlandense]KAJ5808831.1 hypothetical protein N7474_010100 [Penicillium riverlandense]
MRRVTHLNIIHSRLANVTQQKSTILAKHNLQVAGRKREDAEFLQTMNRLDEEEYGLRTSWEEFYNGTATHHENETATTQSLHPVSSHSIPTEAEALTQQNFGERDFFHSNQSSPSSSVETEILPPSPPHIPTTTASAKVVDGDSSMISKDFQIIEDVFSEKRHGRPIGCDSMGRPLWKRQSDGELVYIACPVCGKDSFGTLHGIMCHLKAKHKNRKRPERSKLLDVCGTVFSPSSSSATVSSKGAEKNKWTAHAQSQSQAQAALLLEGEGREKGKYSTQSEGADEHGGTPLDQDKLQSPVLPFENQSIASIMN